MQDKQPTTYISNPFRVVFKGFENLFKYNQNLSIILLIYTLVLSSGSYFDANLDSSVLNNNSSQTVIVLIIVLSLIFLLVILPIFMFLLFMFNGITPYTIVKTNDQQTGSFKEAWKITLSKFWTIVATDAIIFLKIFGGLLLFIVPGVRAMLRYSIVHIFIYDKNVKASEAVEMSKELTKGHLMEILGMSFASGIIPIVGGLMGIGGQAIIYKQLSELKASGSPKPPMHWLNYLAFIVIGIILFIVLLIILIIGGLALSNR